MMIRTCCWWNKRAGVLRCTGQMLVSHVEPPHLFSPMNSTTEGISFFVLGQLSIGRSNCSCHSSKLLLTIANLADALQILLEHEKHQFGQWWQWCAAWIDHGGTSGRFRSPRTLRSNPVSKISMLHFDVLSKMLILTFDITPLKLLSPLEPAVAVHGASASLSGTSVMDSMLNLPLGRSVACCCWMMSCCCLGMPIFPHSSHFCPFFPSPLLQSAGDFIAASVIPASRCLDAQAFWQTITLCVGSASCRNWLNSCGAQCGDEVSAACGHSCRKTRSICLACCRRSWSHLEKWGLWACGGWKSKRTGWFAWSW